MSRRYLQSFLFFCNKKKLHSLSPRANYTDRYSSVIYIEIGSSSSKVAAAVVVIVVLVVVVVVVVLVVAEAAVVVIVVLVVVVVLVAAAVKTCSAFGTKLLLNIRFSLH
jgi:Flp pilus assembly protein TadB